MLTNEFLIIWLQALPMLHAEQASPGHLETFVASTDLI